MIYFIKAGSHVKIGVTNNIGRRIKEIQTSNAETLELLCTIDGDQYEEKWLHNYFGMYHHNGEWFVYNNVFSRFINSLIDGYTPNYDKHEIPEECEDLLSDLYRTVKLFNLTDERLYQYLVSTALINGTVSPILVKQDIRQNTSIVAWKTLDASLTRLINAGLIAVTQHTNYKYPIYKYTICENISDKSNVHYVDTLSPFPVTIYPDIKSEAHLKNGLSGSYNVMIALLNGESQPSALSKRLNTSVGMINKHLQKLLSLKIVQKDKRGRNVYYKLTNDFTDQLPEIFIREIYRVNKNIKMEKDSLDILVSEYQRELSLRDHVGHAKYDMLELHRKDKRMDRFKPVKNFVN